jgi:RHS repeat-associated protein
MVDTVAPAGAAGTAAKDNGYDSRDRLTSTGTGSASTTMTCPTAPSDATVFTYDELGNRTKAVTQDEDRRTLSYDQANRLTKVVDDNMGTNDPAAAMSDQPVTGDFDGDGQDDVMAYRPGGTSDDPVWWGADRDVFGTSTDVFSVSGDFTPLSGDFDGDGYGDILWYKPGTGADYVWFWFGRSGGGHTSRSTVIDTSDYTPFTGDFDGDGRTDIYWYRAGSGTDVIWYGDSGADEADHVYTQQSLNVSGTYRPVAGDFDHDGKDEIFWYGPGSAADTLWDFTSRSAHTDTAKTVSGANYIPVAGDFDGDGNDDIVFNDWTVTGGDTLWWGPGLSSTSHLTVSLATGQLPFAGDFDGDGKDDLFINNYNAGGDTIWWGSTKTDFSTADTGFAASPVTMSATYAYGADGTRTAKTVDGTATTFTYSDHGGLPLLLKQTTGSATTYLIYGPGGQPIEQISNDGTALWLHHDQLGSVRLATKASDGTEHSSRTYNAYGIVASENVTTPGDKQPLLGYAGQYTDTETGYQYLRARYYDPSSGQFLTRDPIAALTEEPYGYVNRNPMNGTDPSGLCGPFGNGGCLGGSLVPNKVSDAVGTAAASAGDVGRAAWRNRDKIATVAAIGVCVGATLGTCAAVTAGAFIVRSQVAIEEDGWEAARGGIITDGIITASTFGLVSVPGSLAWQGSVGAHWAPSAQGIFLTAPEWQQMLSRGLIATPDFLALLGSFNGGC